MKYILTIAIRRRIAESSWRETWRRYEFQRQLDLAWVQYQDEQMKLNLQYRARELYGEFFK